MKAMSCPVQTGKEGLVGKVGEVTDMKGHKGHMKIHGEIWEVESPSRLHTGDRVKVTDVEGLRLHVKKTED